MNQSRKRWLSLSIALFLVFCMMIPVTGSMVDTDTAEDEISMLEQDKKEVENTLKQLNQLKGDTEAYVKKLDEDLNKISDRLAEVEGLMAEKQAEIDIASQELEDAKILEESQYQAMKLRIQYMYEKGDSTYLEMLLSAENASEFLSRAEYISQISEYDRNMLVVYQNTKEEIAAKEIQLKDELAVLAGLKEEAESKQGAVETLITEKNNELEQFDTEINVAEEQMEQYQKDIDEQEDFIRKIEEEIRRKEAAAEESRLAAEKAAEASRKAESEAAEASRIAASIAASEEASRQAEEASANGESPAEPTTTAPPPTTEAPPAETEKPPTSNVNMIWPCPASKRVTSEFGAREAPVAGASTSHKGMDIGAPTGTDIIAAASGEVVISTYSYSAGNYIMISHGNGLSTVYMHCSALLVSVGDQVKQGDVIGKVGSTGYSTGPHLHFGVRVNGAYVNPRGYVN